MHTAQRTACQNYRQISLFTFRLKSSDPRGCDCTGSVANWYIYSLYQIRIFWYIFNVLGI